MPATVSELRQALSSLSLDTRGHKPELKKRLRIALRNHLDLSPSSDASSSSSRHVPEGRPANQRYTNFLVFDVEATCEEDPESPYRRFGYPNEIIEFPVVLLQWMRRRRRRRRRRRMSGDGQNGGDDYGDDDGSKVGNSDCSDGADAEAEEDDPGDDSDDDSGQQQWSLQVTDEWRSFVRPAWKPQLSQFCRDLTGISQVICC
jgi:hypothetical protein